MATLLRRSAPAIPPPARPSGRPTGTTTNGAKRGPARLGLNHPAWGGEGATDPTARKRRRGAAPSLFASLVGLVGAAVVSWHIYAIGRYAMELPDPHGGGGGGDDGRGVPSGFMAAPGPPRRRGGAARRAARREADPGAPPGAPPAGAAAAGGLSAPARGVDSGPADPILEPFPRPAYKDPSSGGFGFVMRDLARRVLSGRPGGRPGGDVLVVSGDAPAAVAWVSSGRGSGGGGPGGGAGPGPGTEEGVSGAAAASGGRFVLRADGERRVEDWSAWHGGGSGVGNVTVGGEFLAHAAGEGHRVHGLGYRDRIDDWWARHRSAGGEGGGGRILLAVFDAALGWEDAILSPRSASQFLSESRMDYVVLGIRATTRKIHSGQKDLKALLGAGYRLQILSVSHFWPDPQTEEAWRPNSLVTVEGAKSIFRWGERAAKKSGDEVFTCYLFGTRGLDLAIPSARVYINTTMWGTDRHEGIINTLEVPYWNCPPRHSRAKILFPTQSQSANVLDNVHILCHGSDVTKKVRSDPSDTEMWASDPDARKAEAACVRIRCDRYRPPPQPAAKKNKKKPPLPVSVACASRVLAGPSDGAGSGGGGDGARRVMDGAARDRPNVLVVHMRSMSRAHLDRYLSLTVKLLQKLEFTEFDHYRAVGEGYGSSLEAMFSIKSPSLVGHHNGTRRWLWEDLHEAGYATLVAEDQCGGKDPGTMQAHNRADSHGASLQRMLCFDFDHPNCLGRDLTAQHLVDYAKSFMLRYSGNGEDVADGVEGAERRPWAAFLSFTDADEDTMSLAGVLDNVLWKFLKWLRNSSGSVWSDTAMLIVSDHGLDRGPYLQSAAGQREYYEPPLFVRLPELIPSQERDKMRSNARMKFATPLDLYATILHVATGRESVERTSLLAEMPDRMSCGGTTVIPRAYCDLATRFRAISAGRRVKPNSCKVVPNPPSILSFYADIPREDHPSWPECDQSSVFTRDRFILKSLQNGHCKCATSHKGWQNCTSAPVLKADGGSGKTRATYFSMVNCANETLRFDALVPRLPELVDRFAERRSASLDADLSSGNELRVPPNILFIEVDSVSMAYADRHFPKTRELLRRHRLKKVGGRYACKSDLCAAYFSKFAIIGPNSITNQGAALSGCMVSPVGQDCSHAMEMDAHGRKICTDPSYSEYGLRFFKRIKPKKFVWCPIHQEEHANSDSTWIFDIASANGYITFFGEEFCYPGSPWVVQDNLFEVKDTTDFGVHEAFCRLAEREVEQKGLCLTQSGKPKAKCPLYQVDLNGNSTHPQPCVDGLFGKPKQRLALDILTSLWAAYPDVPKFAYLNAIAAHDYSMDWSRMTLSAEAYDGFLSEFLGSMMEREEMKNTIIVLRSDHGLQGGPSIIDYSTQIEHQHPWTEIIVPVDHPGISLETLVLNQGKLATGFDLYCTIRSLMSPSLRGTEGTRTLLPPVPDWSVDLLSSDIPEKRTCKDARVPAHYCPCEFQQMDPAPRLGVCNLFEDELRPFCADQPGEFQNHRKNLYTMNQSLSWLHGSYAAQTEANKLK